VNLLSPIGLLGGSFDPIHHGHLRSAIDVCDLLNLQQVELLPNYMSPHKSLTHASNDHRMTMLKLAITDCPQLVINAQELISQQACYTVDTLTKLRDLYPTRPICFLIGMDSLLNLSTWHRWQDILDLCHLVVSARPGSSQPTIGVISDILTQRQTLDAHALHAQLSGLIFIHQTHPLAISSSEIRTLCSQQKSCQFLVPHGVFQYIQKHQLYGYTKPQ